MKKVVLTIAVALFSIASFAQKKISDVAKFESETIDFGKIKQGVPVKGTFTVTNIGNEPLIIEQANPTCGCTISDYTKSPIAPGKTGVINATYNAASPNHFEKHLTVKFAGIEEVKSITFTGDVIPEAVAAAPVTATEEIAKQKVAGSTGNPAKLVAATPKVAAKVATKKITPAKKATTPVKKAVVPVKKAAVPVKKVVKTIKTEVKQ
jgi:hypothetical protein